MLKSPYDHKIDSGDGSGVKLQCDIPGADKSLIESLRPTRGTIQLVVLNLLNNLVNDLRDLNITAWRADGDAILELLTRPRKIDPSVLEEFRIRCSSVSTSETESSGVFQVGGRTGIREESSSDETKSANAKKRTGGRKQSNREENKTEKIEGNRQTENVG